MMLSVDTESLDVHSGAVSGSRFCHLKQRCFQQSSGAGEDGGVTLVLFWDTRELPLALSQGP